MVNSTDDVTKPTLVFIRDLQDGDCLVECPHCRTEISTDKIQNSFCPKCEEDVFYPSWAEW